MGFRARRVLRILECDCGGSAADFEGTGDSLRAASGAPEYPYEKGRGCAFEPGLDHPLLIPSAGDARPDWTLEDFKRAVDQAHKGRIGLLQFHGRRIGSIHGSIRGRNGLRSS